MPEKGDTIQELKCNWPLSPNLDTCQTSPTYPLKLRLVSAQPYLPFEVRAI